MTVLSSLSSKLGVSKSDGMAGIGADQGALNAVASESSTAEETPNRTTTADSGGGHHGAFGTAGSHTGRSDAGAHGSKVLNAVDPRVGDLDFDAATKKYEDKYGTAPQVDVAERQEQASRVMNGFGVDQSPLFPKGEGWEKESGQR